LGVKIVVLFLFGFIVYDILYIHIDQSLNKYG